MLTLSRDLRRQAALFMTMSQVEHILIRLNEAFPLPIFNLLERYSMIEVLRVLQSLVEEGVSVRDLRTIIEALLESDGATLDSAAAASGQLAPSRTRRHGSHDGSARRD